MFALVVERVGADDDFHVLVVDGRVGGIFQMLVGGAAVLVLDFVVPFGTQRRDVPDMEIHIVWAMRILTSFGRRRLAAICIGSGKLVIVVAERMLQSVEILLFVPAHLGDFLQFVQRTATIDVVMVEIFVVTRVIVSNIIGEIATNHPVADRISIA